MRGRVQHYSACLPYVASFVALFSSVIGTEADPDYDRSISVPLAVCEAALFIRRVLSDYATRGRPHRPLVSSALYAAFLAGESGSARVVTITWDASLHGWGMVLRWWETQVIFGSLPDNEDMRNQVWRETPVRTLALEAAALEIDLSDTVVVLRNDAAGALTALQKGSFASLFLKQCAMRAWRLQRSIGFNTLYLHAPGHFLVDEGVDDYSRSGALDVAGPVSSPFLREHVRRLAQDVGWPSPSMPSPPSPTLSSRIFSLATSSQAPRPRTPSPCRTRPAPFAHTAPSHTARLSLPTLPPPPSQCFRRQGPRRWHARSRRCTTLRHPPSSNKLLRASVIRNGEVYIRVRRQYPIPDADVAGELRVAIFAVDLSANGSRARSAPAAPSCGRDASFRGRDPAGSPQDQEERARIHAELAALGLALWR
jgi:hypothetical protein